LQTVLHLCTLSDRGLILKTFTIIGPKIQEIGGFAKNDPLQNTIKKSIEQLIREKGKQKETLLTSGGLGVEWWAIEFALQYNLPYKLYIPFDGVSSVWPKHVQIEYDRFKAKAVKTIQINSGGFDAKKLTEKDILIADNADEIYHFFGTPPKYLLKFAPKLISQLETLDDNHYIAF